MNKHPTISLLAVVWGLLMILLTGTVIVARYDFGDLSLYVALGFAIGKALLIIFFFMHVRYQARQVLLFAGAAYLWLMILIVGTLQDYTSRNWIKAQDKRGSVKIKLPHQEER